MLIKVDYGICSKSANVIGEIKADITTSMAVKFLCFKCFISKLL